ncbi:MAG: phosphonate C-P lyase system protein PhnH [Deltaproteobacteria bacterium]|nr:phosphonate C-P lyase system protein PhnH [Deltaproteobacteria bacterium]
MKPRKPIDMDRLRPGFSNRILESQQTFRAALDALSHPGRVIRLTTDLVPPAPLHGASAALCLTLLDFDTALWADLDASSQAVEWLRFHCGCPMTRDPSRAAFALITRPEAMPLFQDFHTGEAARPELSTTLIIQATGLDSPDAPEILGPGIEVKARAGPEGLPDDFWRQWRAQTETYPLGVDVVFTAGDALSALPRSSRPAA